MMVGQLFRNNLLKYALIGCLWGLMNPATGASASELLNVSDSRAIPEVLLYEDDGGYNHPGMSFALIVDKSRQQARLYRHDGYWQMMEKWPCSTGKLAGPKKMEGDQRTPEGVYFATRNVDERYLTETYGVRALTLDYPNWLDKHMARSGSAIWIHGTSKPLVERDSNGCVVLENTTISRLAQFMRLNRTPVIIVDRIRFQAVKDARELAGSILAAADQWHEAMMNGSFEEFRQWYDRQAEPSMAWWQKWCRQRRKAAVATAYQSLMGQRSIYRCGDYYVLLFDHCLSIASRSQWVGRRKLFVHLDNGNVRILGDTYQTSASRHRDPLFFAWQKLWDAAGNEHEVAAKPKREQDT